jgi:hypothetical protein
MAYIELVDSPKEIGKRIEKRPKVYPTIEELREKAPTMDIYNKPVLHVSENKRTSLLGGMVVLLNRLRTIPIPTVSDLASNLLTPPDLSIEFSNLPGPGQPREKEMQEKVAKSALDIKQHAKEVLARRIVERRDERVRMRKLLGMDGTNKQKKKKAATAAAKNAEDKGEGKVEEKKKKAVTAAAKNAEGKGEGKVEEIKAEAGKEKRTQQPQANKQQANKQQATKQQANKQQANKQGKHHQAHTKQPHAKPQANQQQQHKKNNKNKNKKQGKKK